jgi:hypothetical protein
MNVIAGMTGHGDGTSFGRVPKLPMTAALAVERPTIVAE